MEDIKKLIESDLSAEVIVENATAGRIPLQGDIIRLLQDMGGFKAGDTALITSVLLTEDARGVIDGFRLSLESDEGATGSFDFTRDEVDAKFQYVYDTTM